MMVRDSNALVVGGHVDGDGNPGPSENEAPVR